jgi:hypothetical protein
LFLKGLRAQDFSVADVCYAAGDFVVSSDGGTGIIFCAVGSNIKSRRHTGQQYTTPGCGSGFIVLPSPRCRPHLGQLQGIRVDREVVYNGWDKESRLGKEQTPASRCDAHPCFPGLLAIIGETYTNRLGWWSPPLEPSRVARSMTPTD